MYEVFMYNVSISWRNGSESILSVKGSSFKEGKQNAAKLVRTLKEVCTEPPESAHIGDNKDYYHPVMINGAIL